MVRVLSIIGFLAAVLIVAVLAGVFVNSDDDLSAEVAAPENDTPPAATEPGAACNSCDARHQRLKKPKTDSLLK